jgi:hypothetical protein
MLETLIPSAIALISPLLGEAAKEAAKTLGKDAVDSGGKVLGWMRAKLTGGGKVALAEVERDPTDDNKQKLTSELEKLLTAQPALADELRALVPPRHFAPQNVTQSGTGNVAGVFQGSGNLMNITR